MPFRSIRVDSDPVKSTCLDERLVRIVRRLLVMAPSVERVSCAVFEPGTGLFGTIMSLARSGETEAGHPFRFDKGEFPFGDAVHCVPRMFEDMGLAIEGTPDHAAWLRGRGYGASYVVPSSGADDLRVLLVCDAAGPEGFPVTTRRDLALHGPLFEQAVRAEMSAQSRHDGELAGWRDFEPGAHLESMSRYAGIIASGIADTHRLGRDFVEHVALYAPLHDIGKTSIPDWILTKRGDLDRDERLRMQAHAGAGLAMAQRIIDGLGIGHHPDSRLICNIVGSHHEFVDGSGYPKGLSGAEVPLEARIIAVADTFDALISKRPRKEAWSLNQAFAELGIMAHFGKLDRECVSALRARPDQIVEIARAHADC